MTADLCDRGLEPVDKARIEIRDPELNPRFVLGLIQDIEIRPSPYWIQRRLRLAGMRPINNIVDATNYVMLELGEPLHAFDYDVLVGREFLANRVIVDPGQTFTSKTGCGKEADE